MKDQMMTLTDQEIAEQQYRIDTEVEKSATDDFYSSLQEYRKMKSVGRAVIHHVKTIQTIDSLVSYEVLTGISEVEIPIVSFETPKEFTRKFRPASGLPRPA